MKFPSLKSIHLDAMKDFPSMLPMLITIGFLGRSVSLVNLLASLGVALTAMAFGSNLLIGSTVFALALLLLTYHGPEGFNTNTPPTSISAMVKKLKEGFTGKKDDEEEFKDKDEEEGYRNKDEEEEFRNKDDEEEGYRNKDDEEEGYKSLKDDEEEGFMNMNKVFQNITTAGYSSPGFGMGAPLVEGFEDEKKPETKSKPAPVAKKEELAMPFKLGEIPSQVKNGPHIDASSTLMKAIHSLNPEQINAMTKDTKQLIETQKSLMGMLGTMKPMMNDGKELMETFQEMFGKQ